MRNSTCGWLLMGVGVLLLVVSLLAGTSALTGHPDFKWLQDVAPPLDSHPGWRWLQELGVIIGVLVIVIGLYVRRAGS